MSLLAPLYFLGALAVGLPLLFHLIRRQPRSHLTFSSLMFLRPSPPRLTRRSRLDNLLLLLMRAAALILIAAAFARPFLRSPVQTSAQRGGRQVLLLVDTSASMRRDGVWQRAVAAADRVLDEMQPLDRAGLMVFDSQPRTLVPLDPQADADAGADFGTTAVRQTLRQVQPTWKGSDLGLALSTAADTLNALAASENGPAQQAELVLISDLQAGAGTQALQGYAWPPDVRLAIRTVAPARPTNASAQVLADTAAVGQDADPDAPAETRVRVANAADSLGGQFQLQWADASGQPLRSASANAVNVPPGEVRVVRLSAPPRGAAAIVLTGDDHRFDNVVYMAVPEPVQRAVLFVGPDPQDPRDSLLYYLRQTSLNTPQQTVVTEHLPPDQPLPPLDPRHTALLVVAAPMDDSAAAALRQYAERGGRVLYVLSEPVGEAAAEQRFLRELSGDPQVTLREAAVDDYGLLAEIDFQDPLFSVFADPRFSDFSKIRFWSHRNIQLADADDWAVAARFDDGAPALLRRKLDQGDLFVLAAGWQPNASQLALSTKFVPLVARLVDPAAGDTAPQPSYAVGDPLPLAAGTTATVTTPDGTTRRIGDARSGEWLDRPGIYQLAADGIERRFAVNVPADESRTEPLEPAQLEQLGVPLTAQPTSEQAAALERQMRDIELEQSQQWWRWLVVAAIVLLGIETWWGGWLSKRSPAAAPSTSPPTTPATRLV